MQLALDNETIAAYVLEGVLQTRHLQGLIGVQDEYHVPFEQWDEEVKQWFRYDPERLPRSCWMRLDTRAAPTARDSRPS